VSTVCVTHRPFAWRPARQRRARHSTDLTLPARRERAKIVLLAHVVAFSAAADDAFRG
jgi:hypothetical protein